MNPPDKLPAMDNELVVSAEETVGTSHGRMHDLEVQYLAADEEFDCFNEIYVQESVEIKESEESELIPSEEPKSRRRGDPVLQKILKYTEKQRGRPPKFEVSEIDEQGIAWYTCTVCDLRATGRRELLQHMRTHDKDRPFFCKECGSNFKQVVHLRAHMRMHTGEKPFQCTICGKYFRQKVILDQHMRTHTQDKPYKCTETGCTKEFTQKTSLKNHLKSHRTGKLSELYGKREMSGMLERPAKTQGISKKSASDSVRSPHQDSDRVATSVNAAITNKRDSIRNAPVSSTSASSPISVGNLTKTVTSLSPVTGVNISTARFGYIGGRPVTRILDNRPKGTTRFKTTVVQMTAVQFKEYLSQKYPHLKKKNLELESSEQKSNIIMNPAKLSTVTPGSLVQTPVVAFEADSNVSCSSATGNAVESTSFNSKEQEIENIGPEASIVSKSSCWTTSSSPNDANLTTSQCIDTSHEEISKTINDEFMVDSISIAESDSKSKGSVGDTGDGAFNNGIHMNTSEGSSINISEDVAAVIQVPMTTTITAGGAKVTKNSGTSGVERLESTQSSGKELSEKQREATGPFLTYVNFHKPMLQVERPSLTLLQLLEELAFRWNGLSAAERSKFAKMSKEEDVLNKLETRLESGRNPVKEKQVLVDPVNSRTTVSSISLTPAFPNFPKPRQAAKQKILEPNLSATKSIKSRVGENNEALLALNSVADSVFSGPGSENQMVLKQFPHQNGSVYEVAVEKVNVEHQGPGEKSNIVIISPVKKLRTYPSPKRSLKSRAALKSSKLFYQPETSDGVAAIGFSGVPGRTACEELAPNTSEVESDRSELGSLSMEHLISGRLPVIVDNEDNSLGERADISNDENLNEMAREDFNEISNSTLEMMTGEEMNEDANEEIIESNVSFVIEDSGELRVLDDSGILSCGPYGESSYDVQDNIENLYSIYQL